MVPRRRVLASVAFALVAALAPEAHANGRFPRAERLVERGGDPEKLVLAATYGILVSDDRGADWRHVCELGFAFANAEIDPVVAAFPDDSLVVRGIRSLNRAEAPYCDFAPVLGGEGTDTAADFSLDATDPNRVLGLVMERAEGGGTVNRLYESLDGGRSFAPFGTPLPEDTVTFGITLDVAPSDSSRLYATALALDGGSVFARSDDDGELWTTSALELGPEEYPYIAAVDATNADAIYVRTDSAASVDGVYEANDALLYSDDGGASFRELLRMPAKLLGFALSPDGSELLAGYGDPMDPGRFVDRSVLGIYRASTSDFEFTKVYDGSVSCLAWTETGLYVCTPQDERGFALGFAPNADFELDVEEPFAPLLDLRSVRALDCPSCSGAGACRESWPTTCALFGSCDAGVGGSASSDADCAGAGGTSSTTRGGAGGAMSGGAPAKPSSLPSDDGCACRSHARTRYERERSRRRIDARSAFLPSRSATRFDGSGGTVSLHRGERTTIESRRDPKAPEFARKNRKPMQYKLSIWFGFLTLCGTAACGGGGSSDGGGDGGTSGSSGTTSGSGGNINTGGSGGSATGGSAGAATGGTATGGTGGTPGCTITSKSEISSAIATVGIVTFSTDLPSVDRAHIDFGLDTTYGMTAPVDLAEPSYRTLLLGMKQMRTYHFRIVVGGGTTECSGPDQTIATGPLPNILPTLDVTNVRREALAGGFVQTGQYQANGGASAPAYILDADGDFVWAMRVGNYVTGVRQSFDGKYMWINGSDNMNTGGTNANIHRVTMDGLVDEDLSDEFGIQDHQITILPDESVIFYGHDEDCPTIKRRYADGRVVSIVNASDAHGLTSTCHVNHVEYSPDDQTLIFSDDNHDNYTKITLDGQVVWVLGGMTNDFTGDGAMWDRQHGVDVLANNRLLYFNNGPMMGGTGSQVHELLLDLTAMTATRVWTYTAMPRISNIQLGDTQRLANGNTVIAYSTQGVLQEVDAQGTLLQEIVWPLGGAFGYIHKRASLYGPPPR